MLNEGPWHAFPPGQSFADTVFSPPCDTEITNYLFRLADGIPIQQAQTNISFVCLCYFVLLQASLGGISPFISGPQPNFHTSPATLTFLASTDFLVIRIYLFQLFASFHQNKCLNNLSISSSSLAFKEVKLDYLV